MSTTFLDALPRSVVMITFDDQPYVVISLADGPILYYYLDRNQGLLYERRKVLLGRKPTTLTICQYTDLLSTSTYRHVLFACSDRPSVLSSLNGKLLFSSVNLHEIVCMCSFHSEFYGSCLTLVTDTSVLLGRIDDLRKLHVRTLNLGESVRRMSMIDDEKVFVLLTQHIHGLRSDSLPIISRQAQHQLVCTTQIKSLEQMTQLPSNDTINSIVIVDQHTHEGRSNILIQL
jgi:DNA damage-binding protein 1